MPSKVSAISRLGVSAATAIAALTVYAAPADAADQVSLCGPSGYTCVSGTGYTGQGAWGYPGPHNCTLYAAFRINQIRAGDGLLRRFAQRRGGAGRHPNRPTGKSAAAACGNRTTRNRTSIPRRSRTR